MFGSNSLNGESLFLMINMNIIPGIITFLHDIFTIIWIGGLFFIVIVLMPMIKKMKNQDTQLNQFSIAVQKRLRVFVIISILGLWITGMLLAKQNTAGGFLKFETPYQTWLSIKHLLTLGMILMVIWRSILINKIDKLPNTEKEKKQKLMKQSMLPVLINLIFGIGVLFFTGLLSVTP